jgi:Tfp pilus assembly protein PilX
MTGIGRACGAVQFGRDQRRIPLRTRPRSTVRADTGSVSAFVVLLMVAVMALLGLVVDGGIAMTARQSAFDEAEQAARAGAGAVSVSALRSGSLQIDSDAAVSAAEAFTVAAGHPGVATVSDGIVRVQIRYRIQTQVLGIVGISSLPVAASATAVDEEGVTEGSP